jgi:hypothetical protein
LKSKNEIAFPIVFDCKQGLDYKPVFILGAILIVLITSLIFLIFINIPQSKTLIIVLNGSLIAPVLTFLYIILVNMLDNIVINDQNILINFRWFNLKKVYNKSQIKGLYYHDEQAPTEVLRNQIIFLMNDKRRVVNLHSKWMDIDINDLFVFLSEQYKDIIAQNGGEVKRVTMPN